MDAAVPEPPVFVPIENLAILDLEDALRRAADPKSPHFGTGALFLLRDASRDETRPMESIAFLMREGDRFWSLPRDLVTSTADDADWVQAAERVLVSEPLPVASPGEECERPAVVLEGSAVVGAWIAPQALRATDGTDDFRSRSKSRGDEPARVDQSTDVASASAPGEETAEARASHEAVDETRAASAEREPLWKAPRQHAPARQAEPLVAQRRDLEKHIAAHNRLRDALAQEQEMRDDESAVALLADAGRRVLDVLETLLDNTTLWEKLSTTEREPLTTEEIRQLERFADEGLRGLLIGLGYRPPPPVDDMIDDTLTRLALAQERHTDARIHARRVAAAQRELIFFAIRLRRLVAVSKREVPPSIGRRLLRRADREADVVMGAVSPVLLEGLAELTFPGAGIVAKLAGAVGGVLSTRLLALRPRLEAEEPAMARDEERRDALSRAQRALATLTQMAESSDQLSRTAVANDPLIDRLVAQIWVADEAIRQARNLSDSPGDDDSVRRMSQALGHLREARRAALRRQVSTEMIGRAARLLQVVPPPESAPPDH